MTDTAQAGATGSAAWAEALLQSFAKAEGMPLTGIHVDITGMMDRANPVRQDVSVLNSVHVKFDLKGVTPEQGRTLIDRFKGR